MDATPPAHTFPPYLNNKIHNLKTYSVFPESPPPHSFLVETEPSISTRTNCNLLKFNDLVKNFQLVAIIVFRSLK